jgi:hypothetical protein
MKIFRNSILLSLFLTVTIACAGINLKWGETAEPCTICDEMAIEYPNNNSLICARIPNPCQAQDVLVTFAKAGVIWEAYQVEEFMLWSQRVRLSITTGTSYKGVYDLIIIEVSKFNKKMAGTFLLVSEMIIDFQDVNLIDKADQHMLLLALDDLEAQVARFAILK